MPQYTCSTATWPSGGQPFMLTSAGQTFCPKCYNNTLQPFTPPRQSREGWAVVNDGSTMSNTSRSGLNDCYDLIDKFTLIEQSEEEARTTADYIVKLGSDKPKRIDRQGPVMAGGTITHARFAIQLGTALNAGIHMPIDTRFTIQHVRTAFRESLKAGKYVRIFKEEV